MMGYITGYIDGCEVNKMDFRQKTLIRNNTICISLPKGFCLRHNINGEEGEYVDVIVHQVVKKNKIIDICKVKYESSNKQIDLS